MDWPDGKTRCPWANPNNPRYLQYHDKEWGVPVHDDQKLFEMLILENFQAGLSWECVLNKWEAFSRAFDGFNLEKVCSYGPEEQARLKSDPGIIRNGRKIAAAVQNARVFREIQREWGSFDRYLWHWTEGPPPAVRPGIQGSEKTGNDFCGDSHHLRLPPGRRGRLVP